MLEGEVGVGSLSLLEASNPLVGFLSGAKGGSEQSRLKFQLNSPESDSRLAQLKLGQPTESRLK